MGLMPTEMEILREQVTKNTQDIARMKTIARALRDRIIRLTDAIAIQLPGIQVGTTPFEVKNENGEVVDVLMVPTFDANKKYNDDPDPVLNELS